MASPEQLEILHSVALAAQAAQRKWGVPASVTMAQWIFESSWGTSELAQKANNYFGVKYSHSAIPNSYVEFDTVEYVSGKRMIVHALFQKYADEAASFEAHARLLATAGRYRCAMQQAAHPDTFAARLQTAGYSTNPRYAQMLTGAMHQFNLYQYDVPPSDPVAAKEAA